MKAVLSREGEAMISRLAAERGLLAFDFDGTLAPIVEDRALASMRPVTRGLLRVAALLYPCAVISGRERTDVAQRVASVPLLEVIGNHGADTMSMRLDPKIRVRVKSWVGALEDSLGDIPGIDIERKSCSVAIHYRSASVGPVGVARITTLATTLPGSRVFGGDAVINVVPAEAPSKGDAIEDLARRQSARAVMFVGDDVTDEDAFRSPVVTYPIRVGRARRSAATWYIDDQLQIDAVLRLLVKARARHSFPSDDWLPSRAPGGTGDDP